MKFRQSQLLTLFYFYCRISQLVLQCSWVIQHFLSLQSFYSVVVIMIFMKLSWYFTEMFPQLTTNVWNMRVFLNIVLLSCFIQPFNFYIEYIQNIVCMIYEFSLVSWSSSVLMIFNWLCCSGCYCGLIVCNAADIKLYDLIFQLFPVL